MAPEARSSRTDSTRSSGISQTRSPFCCRSAVVGIFLSKKKTKAKRPTTSAVRTINFRGVMEGPSVAAAVPDPDAEDDREDRHPHDREEADPVDLRPRQGQGRLLRRLGSDPDEPLLPREPGDRIQEEVRVAAVAQAAVGQEPR